MKSNREIAVFNTLKKKYSNFKRKVVITESTLRLEKSLGTQQTVTFDVLNGTTTGGTPNSTEKRLNISDSFFITSLFVGLLKVASGSSNPVNILQTYPNSILFSGSGEAANLMNIYNGYLSISINQTTYLQGLDLMRFYRAGVSQNGVLTAASGTNNAYVANQWPEGNWGFYNLQPGILLDGGSTNLLNIDCPASIAMAGTSSTNYAVLMARGFLIQNGSAR